MACVNLKPNWNLLDSSFESYKLSLEQLPSHSVKLDTGPDVVTPQDEDFSYQRTKLLTMNNYLIADPWNDRTCYYIDPNGRVKRFCVTIETSIPKPSSIFQLEHYTTGIKKSLPVSMSFPSSDLCLFVDDVGHCCLVNTGDRSTENMKWRTIFDFVVVEDESCKVMMLQSRQREHDSSKIIDMAILKFHDRESETVVYIEWVTITNKSGKWQLGKRTIFKASHIPFFVGFGKESNTIHIGSQAKITSVPNWEQELSQNDIKIEDDSDATVYNWKQGPDDITVSITLPAEISNESVVCKFTAKNVEICTKNDSNEVKCLVKGELFEEADPDLCNWTISKDLLEVSIQKKNEGCRWEYFLEGDADQEIHDDVTMTEVRGFQPTGLDKYEDCDDLPDASSVLYCYDGDTDNFTYEASLASNQWLFNCYHEQSYCTVLRHDVDALMWTCNAPQSNTECPWSHIATFNALGYVKASKQDVKFSNCASNTSYAALCESVRRIFVYHTSTAASAPLRNRVTGKQAHLSKQQVVTLPSNDPIYGFHTADDMIFVLTVEELYVIKMCVPQS